MPDEDFRRAQEELQPYAAILHIMLAVDFTAGCYLRPVILQIFFVTLLILVN